MNAANARARVQAALTDLRPRPDDIAADAVAGLSRTPKRLPSKYFYDAEGSRLFEAITRQPEYYLTRTELALLEARMDTIAQRSARACTWSSSAAAAGARPNCCSTGWTIRSPIP